MSVISDSGVSSTNETLAVIEGGGGGVASSHAQRQRLRLRVNKKITKIVIVLFFIFVASLATSRYPLHLMGSWFDKTKTLKY